MELKIKVGKVQLQYKYEKKNNVYRLKVKQPGKDKEFILSVDEHGPDSAEQFGALTVDAAGRLPFEEELEEESKN